MGFRVEIDKTDLARIELMFSFFKNGTAPVMVRILNKTLTSMQSQAAKEVSNVLNLTQKRIKEDFGKSHKATYNNISAGFVSSGEPVPLIQFSRTTQNKTGVRVTVLKNKGSKVIKHAFKNRIWKGEEDVGQRIYDGQRKEPKGTYPYSWYRVLPSEFPIGSGINYRWPVRKLRGPRIEDELAKPNVIGAVMSYAGERIAVLTEQEISYELMKYK